MTTMELGQSLVQVFDLINEGGQIVYNHVVNKA